MSGSSTSLSLPKCISGMGIENEEIRGNPENFDFFYATVFGGSWGNLRAPGGRKSEEFLESEENSHACPLQYYNFPLSLIPYPYPYPYP